MITEDYVSFETAKLLKEKGFDCACKVWYSEYTSQFGGEKYTSIEFDNHNKFNENFKFICSTPTLQMVMKWIRVKDYQIIVKHTDDNGYFATILTMDNANPINKFFDGYNTYEEACEAAIKYCLENLI